MKRVVLPTIILFFTIYFAYIIQAASYDYAVSLEITSPVVEGNIVSFEAGKYVLSVKPYDGNMVGVVNNNPAVFLQDVDTSTSVLVSSDGEITVKVSTINGSIKIGDFVTSSSIPGVGQKADIGGYILGTALDEYVSSDETQIGEIGVLVNIRSNFDSDPLTKNLMSLRYVVALLTIVSTFIFSFAYFGKISNRSVEAVGRNPLAKASIKRIMFINFSMIFVILLIGLGISYLILIL